MIDVIGVQPLGRDTGVAELLGRISFMLCSIRAERRLHRT